MATYTTYDEVGVKEDIADIITNISPTKTPFQMVLKSEKVHQPHHQWQEDALDAAADNTNVEGADAPAASQTATTLRGNYTQILVKTVKVSGTADVTQAYGRAKESAYQMSKKMQEIKRDLEKALVGFDRAATAGNSSTARIMQSAPNMIDAGNVVTNVSTALTEANVLTVLQDLYNAGGEADTLMIKPADSTIVADFAKATGRQRELNDKQYTVTNVVRVYESPYDTVKVVMNRFQLTTVALLFSAQYWRLLVLRNWFRETLAKTGDSLNMMIVGEFSVAHKNFKASGAVKGLS